MIDWEKVWKDFDEWYGKEPTNLNTWQDQQEKIEELVDDEVLDYLDRVKYEWQETQKESKTESQRETMEGSK